MASNYDEIKVDNERRYGTDIGDYGNFWVRLYADRTHFLFELIQNTEDALARRAAPGPRSLTFDLSRDSLRVSHYGKPFDFEDVRSICSIAKSTKQDLTSIGRFGIGFKSVYAFTDRPEIHSGDEAFAVENFVWPQGAIGCRLSEGETVIRLPFREQEDHANVHALLAAGLERLGLRTLLFLRQIDSITCRTNERSRIYRRETAEALDQGVRRVRLGGGGREETWLVFESEVRSAEGEGGRAEIAFQLTTDGRLHPLEKSPLVVYFPTEVETQLGFLLQGPFRTTPSRDNVPPHDPWNQTLFREAGDLLVKALRWLRDHDLIDTAALRCLPQSRSKLNERFLPIFDRAVRALLTEPLLPTQAGGCQPAPRVRLADSKELRELLDPAQLGQLLESREPLYWLPSDISRDRTPELYTYLRNTLGIEEVTPDMILRRITARFLEAQPDAWIVQFYEFLSGQQRLIREPRFKDLPVVRLEDGHHVSPLKNGQPQAFLPPREANTAFPTVRRALLDVPATLAFLTSLGLVEPEVVDEVIRNVLPRYPSQPISVPPAQYAADIGQIVAASKTDSKTQRERLVAALKEATFVRAVKPDNDTPFIAKPSFMYLPNRRMKALFDGVGTALLVDDSLSCLQGVEVSDLLESCGASRTFHLQRVARTFSDEERRDLRRRAGYDSPRAKEEGVEDSTLRDLEPLLAALERLTPTERKQRSALLWEALLDLRQQRREGAFSGSYRWFHHEQRSTTFDAAFVKRLNEAAWVPDEDGNLHPPAEVAIESLGWRRDPFLESKFTFKRPIIDQLAQEAGIEPALLELLKRMGVKTPDELLARLIPEEPAPTSPEDAVRTLLGDSPEPEPPGTPPEPPNPPGRTPGDGRRRIRTRWSGPPTRGSGTSTRSRPFISYVGTHPHDEADPDHLDHAARMALEARAIALILQKYPHLRRTPTHNPGFDLFEPDAQGNPISWIEVKAMKGRLDDRPVGLSHVQFEHAGRRGAAYWLYVVEQTEENPRIVRIQDPAGRARTFTFDHGWRHIAAVDPQAEE